MSFYCSDFNDNCFCQYDDPNFGFKYDSGLYCCQKTKEQCRSYYSDTGITNVTCTGEALNLSKQCHLECNFYGFDEDRNYYVGTVRSYLNICQDNRYEFKLHFLSILQRLNNKGTLFRTCVDETQLCKGKPLCGNGNDLKWCKDVWKLPSPNFTYTYDDTLDKFHSKCTKGHQPENFVPNGQDILSEDIGDVLFTIALIEQMNIHSRKLLTINLEVNLGQSG